MLFATARTVIAGSQTFDSSSGNFSMPAYNTLTVEIWGGGSSSVGQTNGSTVNGNAGGATTCSTLSMTANGAAAGITIGTPPFTQPGAAGTASGGNTTNTTGNVGDIGVSPGTTSPCTGAGAPNGGGNVTTPSGANTNGTNGSTPGGGGSGVHFAASSGAGGSSGGYSKSVYTFGVTSGFPAIGALLAWAVGSGGAAAGTTPADALNQRSGAGANGRVKFTWS